MNLNSIETSLNALLGSFSKVFCNFVDLINGHGSWWVCSVFRSIDTIALERDIRRADSLLSEKSGGACSSNMPDLAVDEAALCVHSIGDTFPPRDLSRGMNSWDTRVSRGLSDVSNEVREVADVQTHQRTDVGGFSQLQTAFVCSLAVVLHGNVSWSPNSIRLLDTSHTSQWCLNDPMIQLQRSQLNWCKDDGICEWLEAGRRDSGRHD